MLIKNEDDLKIRPLQKEDLPKILKLYQKYEVMKYIPNSDIIWDIEKITEKVSRIKIDDRVGVHIVENIDGDFVGEASVFIYPQLNNVFEIGFILDKKYWGLGLGTKICRLLLEYCKDNLHARSVYARMYEANKASTKVCLKCGMKVIGRELHSDNQFKLTMLIDF